MPRRSRRSRLFKAVHQLVHDPSHGTVADIEAIEDAGIGVRVALNDLYVEAVVGGVLDGLEGDEPAAGVLRVLSNGFTSGLEHAQLAHDIGSSVVWRAHGNCWGKG